MHVKRIFWIIVGTITTLSLIQNQFWAYIYTKSNNPIRFGLPTRLIWDAVT